MMAVELPRPSWLLLSFAPLATGKFDEATHAHARVRRLPLTGSLPCQYGPCVEAAKAAFAVVSQLQDSLTGGLVQALDAARRAHAEPC